jgi:hypothetical protein
VVVINAFDNYHLRYLSTNTKNRTPGCFTVSTGKSYYSNEKCAHGPTPYALPICRARDCGIKPVNKYLAVRVTQRQPLRLQTSSSGSSRSKPGRHQEFFESTLGQFFRVFFKSCASSTVVMDIMLIITKVRRNFKMFHFSLTWTF